MKKEIRLFFTAVMFFTRIPCPAWTDHSSEYLNHSSKYFPLVGIVVGLITAAFILVAGNFFSLQITIILSTALSALVTGAFHEDGLADFFDGFGGGWTKERILDIMKDSRIGSFGFLGLLLTLMLKISILQEFSLYNLPLIIISAHAVSRLTSVSFLFTDAYVMDDDRTKSKPMATKITRVEFLAACFFGLAPLIFFFNGAIFLTLIPIVIMREVLRNKFNRWIGGYTGDCLGATQQLCELVFYLSVWVLHLKIPAWRLF